MAKRLALGKIATSTRGRRETKKLEVALNGITDRADGFSPIRKSQMAEDHYQCLGKMLNDVAKLPFYSLTWHLVNPFLGFILRRRAKQGKEDTARILERFGLYQTSLPKGAVWVHAVSVGETVAGLSLIEALAPRLPSQAFIVTTNTMTAAKLVMTGQQANLTHLFTSHWIIQPMSTIS